MTILVTGGAGFIGSNFILDWFAHNNESVINLDKLTYAGYAENLAALKNNPGYIFAKGDIGDRAFVKKLLDTHKPRAILNFAAESHVDRSISGPKDFIDTNIVGTFNLLETVRAYWQDLTGAEKENFRFLHVSTDEVYGCLNETEPAFTEEHQYQPNSPYSASKAASDHLVRAYGVTYGFPVLTTNCSNNYGSFQFPEKLIPLIIKNALALKPLPIYGDGKNVRDWIFVTDHCAGVRRVLESGRLGETYNLGGVNEKANIDVVHVICDILDKLKPKADGSSYKAQITFVKDRAGHDRRYAIDITKAKNELGWTPKETFETGILKTVQWYLDNQDWVRAVEQKS